MRFVRIQPVEIETTSVVQPGSAPFPLRLGVAGGPVVHLIVGRVELLTSPDTVMTSPIWPDWRLLTDGSIEVRYLSNLAMSTKYRIHFLGVANA